MQSTAKEDIIITVLLTSFLLVAIGLLFYAEHKTNQAIITGKPILINSTVYKCSVEHEYKDLHIKEEL